MEDDTNDYVSMQVERSKVESNEGWRNWCKEAPWLQFPPELEVKLLPPFGGAMARFMARFPDSENHVSVYWDCHDTLGAMDEPYWELYPVKYKGEESDYFDTARFRMGREPQMMVAIIRSLMGEYHE